MRLIPKEPENSKREPSLAGHYKGIYTEVGGQNTFHVTVCKLNVQCLSLYAPLVSLNLHYLLHP